MEWFAPISTYAVMEPVSSKFILNLGNVSHIDSAGLGELISIYTSVRNRKGDVKLLSRTKGRRPKA